MNKAVSLRGFSRQLLSKITYYSGYCLLSNSLRLNVGTRILCFHGINDNYINPYGVAVSDFSEQMRFLSNNYEVVQIDRVIARIQEGKSLQSSMIAVSFDDGYQDFYFHAYPILKKYAIPATVFLPTGSIDGISKYNHMLPQRDFLSWDQIRELKKNGIGFGSHTVSHRSLRRLSQMEIHYELESSKARLESELNVSIAGFAYPYGAIKDTSPRIEKWISETGYSWAVTSIGGSNGKNSNPFALRRTVIMRDDGLEGFKRALSGALDGWIVMQKGGYYLDKILHG
jgi:peptidoglycan/xylan/chitin deacetylase (PgdA/CDA1 family)